ncbi:interleukin-like EMT inducer domain-containing protein [Salinisphaera sp. LB1]|uniref:phage tail tip protein J-related protein n=1 Tax=Salinisphaera sp. LB1 TaxID=2183911 RepID=UPI00351A8674
MLVTPRLYSEYSYSLSAYNPPEGLKVRFTNSDTWEDDEIIVYDDGESVDTAEIFASVDAPGCISSDQAYNFGRYHLANQRLRGIESHSFAIDFDHLHFDRGDTIDFQSQQILVGLATGRVLDVATNDTGDITGFTADEFLPMDVATYGCRFDTSDGQRFVAQVDTNSPGSYDLTFTTPIDTTVNDIAPGDLFAFGETGKITTPLKVTQIDRKSEQKAAITCEPAAPNILDALEGDIPVFEPKITQPSDPGNYPPATPKITDVISDASVSVENDDGSLTWRVAVNVQAMSGPVHTAYIEVQAKTADQSKYATARAQDGVAYFTGFNPGDVLTIRIRSVSENGRVSIWVYQYDYTVTGRLPQKPTDVDVQIGTFANTLTPQGGQPATVYEFYRSGVQLDASNIEAQAAFIGQGSSLTDGDLTPETEYFYYVRAVNKYGYSDWYTRSVTTKNSPSAVLKNLSNSISQSDLQNSLLEPIHLITADADTDGSVSQRISETLSTKADADTVSSLWTVRLQGQTADGKNIYSGFGLGLNGDTSSAIFNVDDFAIGSPDANATYAFIEKDGKVIINEALIGTVTFNKLVDGSGNFLVNNNGELKASYIETSGITIGSLSGTADWQTQVAGAGKPTDNADVTKDNAAKSISITDTRNDNQPPSWYRTNYGVQVVSEFKYATSIGLTSAQVGSQYCTLITHAQWSDSSGGPLTQAVHCDNGIFVRQSVNETTWGSWNKADQTSQNTSANTAAVGSLNVSDIESASFNGFFNGFEGSTFNNWAVASGNTITASTDSFSGAQAGLFTSTSTSPTPFTTGAASIYIPAQIALRFAGQPILIQVYAKQPSASASTEFAVAYSTEEVGNSGWHRFTPTTSYAPYSFVYDVPMPNGGGVDSISIWADTSGAGNGVIIDEVAVSLLTGSAYIDALQTANAPAQAGADVTGSNTANDVKTGVGKAVAEAGADKTYNNVAKSVIGQKALATQDNVAWGSQVTGKPLTFRVVARGNSATSQPVEAGLYDAAGTLISGSSRSYRVDVLDRATRAWDSHTIYDVYGNASNATTMANDLNALGSGKIVVIRTYDEPQDHRLTNGLPAAIYRCGGSRSIFGSSNFRYRSAYICVGIPGIGEGNGIELYAGDVDSDPNAWVETAFTIDASGAIQLGRTMVKDAVDISYADGTTVENLKPSQANADKTSSNTSADTANVNGTPAATVASNAATAKQMTSAWASANNTTLINGGKIATDTVYVDTIVVAGDAITVPLFSYSNTTYSNGSGFPSGVYTDIFRADYVANAFGNYNGVLDNTSPLVVTCLLLYSIFDAHNAVSIDLTIKKISDKYPNGTVIFQQTVVDNNGSGSLSIPLFVNIEDPAGLGIQISAMPKGNAYRITYASISFQHFKR